MQTSTHILCDALTYTCGLQYSSGQEMMQDECNIDIEEVKDKNNRSAMLWNCTIKTFRSHFTIPTPYVHVISWVLEVNGWESNSKLNTETPTIIKLLVLTTQDGIQTTAVISSHSDTLLNKQHREEGKQSLILKSGGSFVWKYAWTSVTYI